jgi:dipeptidyl aminopeptidase/acylaminoacyl peptidase
MPSSTLLRRPAVLLALGLCAIAAVTTLLGSLTKGPAVESKPVTLPDTAGVVAYLAFSPDGNRLAYSQRGVSKDDAFHIFVRRLPSGAAQQFTTGSSNDISPAWSPDGGSIALLRLDAGRAQCIIVPANGGPERKVAELAAAGAIQPLPRLSWLRDGKSLAVVTGGENQPASIALVDIANGSLRRITNPPDGTEGDWSPAISPDGSTLAFTRSATASDPRTLRALASALLAAPPAPPRLCQTAAQSPSLSASLAPSRSDHRRTPSESPHTPHTPLTHPCNADSTPTPPSHAA